MKNPILIIAAIVILGILGVGVFTLSQKGAPDSDSMTDADRKMMNDDEVMDKDDHGMMDGKSNSRYVEYSKSAFDNAVDKRRVLYFYASWCPICRPADANFKENINKIPEDLVLIRVNYNDSDTDESEKDLAKKYGITYQHTFVQIDMEGKEVAKWNGGQIDELLSNIK